MKTIISTRMELLARKEQIELAHEGFELLEQKRVALLDELLRAAHAVMEETHTLEEAAANAHRALARAEATAGAEAVRSTALASRDELLLDVTSLNVMGVRVPIIEPVRVARSMIDRGYAIVGTSTTIDEAAAAFEGEVEAIIRLAESELRLRRLAVELQRATRRANALKYVLIPRLEQERDYIEMVLAEREHADHFRLKLTKRALERKRETPS